MFKNCRSLFSRLTAAALALLFPLVFGMDAEAGGARGRVVRGNVSRGSNAAIVVFANGVQILADGTFVTFNGLTIVPFAIPVAVPVAVVQAPQVFYGMSAYGTGISTGITNQHGNAYSPPGPAVGGQGSAGTDAPASLPTSGVDESAGAGVLTGVGLVLKNRCAECHGRPTPPKGLSLTGDTDPGTFSEEIRENMLRKLLAADEKLRMPPASHGPLTAEEFDELFNALVK